MWLANGTSGFVFKVKMKDKTTVTVIDLQLLFWCSYLYNIESSVLQDKVRPGDAWYLIFSAAHASPRAREMVWSFIREKWALLTERYKGMFLITRIVDVSFT